MLIRDMVRQTQRPYFANITSDFTGKIIESVVENPNIAKYAGSSFLIAPTGTWVENLQSMYDKIKSLDSISFSCSPGININQIGQELFSFNLISIVEKIYGVIPALGTLGKVVWLKNNLSNLACNWYGYGTCSTGNKANIRAWASDSAWGASIFSNTSTIPSLISLSYNISTLSYIVSNDGFYYVLAYTDASNGTVASTIYTDYINLVLTFKN